MLLEQVAAIARRWSSARATPSPASAATSSRSCSPRTDAAGALTLAEKLRVALARPMTISGIDLEIDASIGIAIFPEHGADADDTHAPRRCRALPVQGSTRADVVCRRAGSLLPRAARARDRPASCRRLAGGARRLLPAAGRSARAARSSAPRRSCAGSHPSPGLLTPDDFLPLAERTGLMRPLTRIVLDASLRQCRAWRDARAGRGGRSQLSADATCWT